ncbi:MAG: hypothetical protein Q7T55_05500 [Solirubrobacteraceae bacterium]|nr:hypothetical protein [Solirubrobacteraceae bacterium]
MIALAIIGLVGTLATSGVFGGGSEASDTSQAPSGQNSGSCINSGSVGGDMTCQTETKPGPADLKATLDVRNGASKAPAGEYTSDSQTMININLRNDGQTGLSIDRTRLVVEDVADIEPCEPSGGEEIRTWPQGVAVPAEVSAGTVLNDERSAAFRIDADDAGRIGMKVTVDQEFERAALRKLLRARVELRLVSDGTWHGVGSALVSVPGTRVNEFTRDEWHPETGTADDVAYGECLSRNRELLARLADGPGVEMGAELQTAL